MDDGGRFPVNVRAEYGASPDALRPMTLGAGSAFALGAGDVVLDSAEFGAEGQRVRLGWDAMYDLGPGLHRPWVRLTATAATAEAPDAVYTTRVTVDHTLRLTDGAVVGQWPREEVELVDLAAGDLSGDARLDLLALVRRLDVQQKMQMMQAELWVEEGTAFDTVNTGFVDRIGVLGLCTSPTCPQLRSMRPQALYVGSPGALAGERDTAYLWGQRSGNGASVLGEVTWEGVEEGYAARALVYGAALGAQVREGRLSDTLPHDRSAPTRELVVRTEDGRVWRHPEPLGGVMNLTPEPLFEEADGALALLGGDLNADGRGDVVVLVDAAPGVLELRALVSAPDIAQGEVQAGVVLALDAGVTVLGAHMHDMNRDGLDDLIVATDAPDVQLWLRDPSGDVYGAGDGPLEEVSFRHASTQALAAAAVDMDAADVDASRAGDVVLALGAGGWGVWHDPSRGGAFYTGEALNAGLAPDRQLGELERVERVLVYDDDRDGLGTIVVAGYSADALRIGGWEVDAPPRLCRPRWSAPQTLKPHEVAPSGLLADINGDGRPDVVLGHRGDGPLWEVAVSWGDGVGGELGATRLALDAGDGVSAPARIMAFDVDGDAYPEVVVLTEARLYVFSGAGLSASQEASPAASVELSGCAARDVVALDAEAGDGAGDGDWDLLVACDEGLALARNEGALSFAGSVSVAPGAGVGWVEVDDAARAKVFYACGDERCLGRWSDAEGALVELGRFGLSDQGPGVAADLDGDGDQDLLIVDGLPRATAYLNVGGAAQRVNVPVSVEDDVLAVAALGGVEGAWVAVLRGSDDPRAALGLAIDVLKATTREADLDVRFEVEAVVFPQAERVGDGHPRELGLAPSPHGERPELVWFGRQTQRWSGDLPLKHRPPVAAPVDIASPGGVTVAAPERGQGPRVLAWGATEGDVRLEVVDARDLDAVRVAPALTVPVGWEAPDRAAVGRLGGSAALSVALYRSSDDGGALWLRFDDAVGAWTVLRADAGALAEAMMLDVDGDGQREAYVVWRGDAGAGGWLRGDLWTMRDGGLVALPVGDGLLGDPVYGDARVAALAAGDLDADGRGDVWGWLDLEQNQSARFAYSGAASFEAFAEGAAPLVTDGQAQTTALADVRWAGVPAVVAVLRRWEEGAYAGDALVMGYGELGGLARFGPGDGGTAEVPLAQALASDVWRGLRVAPVAPEQSRYVFVDEAARGRTAMFTAHPESTGARSRGYWSWGAASAPPAFEDADGDGVADMVVLRSGGQSAQVIIAPGAARRAP